MRRALGILPMVAFALAACAAPNSGGGAGDNESQQQTMPAASHDMAASSMPSASGAPASAPPSDDVTSSEASARVAIDDVLTDPAAFADEEITISENIDAVFVDDLAFLFGGTEVDGQLLVVVTPDAPIDKEIEEDRVVTVTGSLVPFTAEDLEAAGAGISIDDEMLAGFEGDLVLIATAISDPLAG
ncbi:MAG: hypothetical protein ACRDG7_05975 [Candidatus Limnocylindria bacterium]